MQQNPIIKFNKFFHNHAKCFLRFLAMQIPDRQEWKSKPECFVPL